LIKVEVLGSVGASPLEREDELGDDAANRETPSVNLGFQVTDVELTRNWPEIGAAHEGIKAMQQNTAL
jgi:hypothetical protein